MQVTIPPPQYDHAFPGIVIERILPLEEVRKLCQQIGVGYVDGCAGFVTLDSGEKACFIVLPVDGFDSVAAYRRHEVSHCNGWPASHRDE